MRGFNFISQEGVASPDVNRKGKRKLDLLQSNLDGKKWTSSKISLNKPKPTSTENVSNPPSFVQDLRTETALIESQKELAQAERKLSLRLKPKLQKKKSVRVRPAGCSSKGKGFDADSLRETASVYASGLQYEKYRVDK
jgi:hypothetical protein